MSIKVDHITKLFGTQKALYDVSLDIKPGEVVGLLGPNGAGKSTLMKILTCYIPPTSGDASVCGFDVLEQSIEVRRRVGYLPENNPLYLDLYVKEFLQFIGNIEHRGSQIPDPRSRISEILELTGLQVEQHKQIGTLSRGYRQRVGLAQALLHDPEVLILDEPTSGLDPNQIVEIRNLISQIGREKTIMMSTHIIQEVEAICNRTIIIHKGEIVADDKTKNLQKIQSSKVIVKVEFDKLVEEKNLKSIHGVKNTISPASRTRDPGSNIWHLESTTEIDIRPAVFQFAVDNGLTVLSLQRDEQKLEEVFQELTKT
ncbi:MAG: gliding motility-associated ABC transporter ATP-binding subunit GldA [Bacteroidales bacterium]|nr:gliding motility-associated ABC transporter ATP-binding subunit GldA [Bacteroidota bacterium]MBL6949566.1 gliding motility-associated ABC transporter ATP-binding subunit GldA [Bacteroidales bacterium]